MYENIKGGRLYYPPEDPNNPDDRDVMHPETNEGQVIMHDGKTLEETMKNGRLVTGTKQPVDPCIWGKTGTPFAVDDE